MPREKLKRAGAWTTYLRVLALILVLVPLFLVTASYLGTIGSADSLNQRQTRSGHALAAIDESRCLDR